MRWGGLIELFELINKVGCIMEPHFDSHLVNFQSSICEQQFFRLFHSVLIKVLEGRHLE